MPSLYHTGAPKVMDLVVHANLDSVCWLLLRSGYNWRLNETRKVDASSLSGDAEGSVYLMFSKLSKGLRLFMERCEGASGPSDRSLIQ